MEHIGVKSKRKRQERKKHIENSKTTPVKDNHEPDEGKNVKGTQVNLDLQDVTLLQQKIDNYKLQLKDLNLQYIKLENDKNINIENSNVKIEVLNEKIKNQMETITLQQDIIKTHENTIHILKERISNLEEKLGNEPKRKKPKKPKKQSIIDRMKTKLERHLMNSIQQEQDATRNYDRKKYIADRRSYSDYYSPSQYQMVHSVLGYKSASQNLRQLAQEELYHAEQLLKVKTDKRIEIEEELNYLNQLL